MYFFLVRNPIQVVRDVIAKHPAIVLERDVDEGRLVCSCADEDYAEVTCAIEQVIDDQRCYIEVAEHVAEDDVPAELSSAEVLAQAKAARAAVAAPAMALVAAVEKPELDVVDVDERPWWKRWLRIGKERG